MTPETDRSLPPPRLGLRAGDWVEVRSAAEIFATLDAEGALANLPFMPEMLQYCGRRFQVFKVAHKACDTVTNWKRIRLMQDAVHLKGLRCDGSAHDGCGAACMLYWKESWLKRVPAPTPQEAAREAAAVRRDDGLNILTPAQLDVLQRGTRTTKPPAGAAVAPAAAKPADPAAPTSRYRCQATDLVFATTQGRWFRPGPYIRDLTSGNVDLWTFLKFGAIAAINSRRPFPPIQGRAGAKTPTGEVLNLKVGDWVTVRSKDEILDTLNGRLRHKGLFFDVEMLPFCGGTYRILSRVDRLIDDITGLMREPKSNCFILEGVACGGCRSRARMFCPRSIYPYWHEAWLRRAEPPSGAGGARS